MPKLKTRKSAAKRFKKTKNGKVLHHRAYAGHLKTAKSAKRRRNLRKSTVLAPANAAAVKAMLPY